MFSSIHVYDLFSKQIVFLKQINVQVKSFSLQALLEK